MGPEILARSSSEIPEEGAEFTVEVPEDLDNSPMSLEEILNLSEQLKNLISQNKPRVIEFPGEGKISTAEITFPYGKTGRLFCTELRKETSIGFSMVCEDRGCDFLHINPYFPGVKASELEKREVLVAVDWEKIEELLPLLPKVESR